MQSQHTEVDLVAVGTARSYCSCKRPLFVPILYQRYCTSSDQSNSDPRVAEKDTVQSKHTEVHLAAVGLPAAIVAVRGHCLCLFHITDTARDSLCWLNEIHRLPAILIRIAASLSQAARWWPMFVNKYAATQKTDRNGLSSDNNLDIDSCKNITINGEQNAMLCQRQ